MKVKSIVVGNFTRIRYDDHGDQRESVIIGMHIFVIDGNLMTSTPVQNVGLHFGRHLMLVLENNTWIYGNQVTHVYLNREWKEVEYA